MTNEKMRETFSLGIYEKAIPPWLALREKLQAAARYGYSAMELSIDESDERLARLEAPQTWRREVLEIIRDTGIALPTLCLSGHRKYPIGSADPTVRSRGMEIMRKAIELASSLGVRIIQIAGYDVYYEPSTPATRALFAENLAKSVEYAARYGVCLAFETMETPFMNTVEKALEFVKSINSPYLQLYPDVGNVTNAFQGDVRRIVQDLRCGEGHTVAVHLKETKPGVFREVSYGQGRVDFDSCIAEMAKQGVRIFTSEFWFSPSSDWEAEIENAHSFLFKKLERIFTGD
jgi:L-ribulose-5-phosphate 3-epimerase